MRRFFATTALPFALLVLIMVAVIAVTAVLPWGRW